MSQINAAFVKKGYWVGFYDSAQPDAVTHADVH